MLEANKGYGKGHFLIANPVLPDPNFSRTVVLLCNHDDQGSFGLVINRSAPISAKEVFADMGVLGEESGNVQIVKEVFVDCDDDTVLLKVEQVGKAACHKGYTSCFFRKVNGDVEVIEEKVFDPEIVYKK